MYIFIFLVHNNGGGNIMSEKELMYIDDALSHLEQIDSIVKSVKDSCEEDICTYLDKLLEKNKKTFTSFYKLLK